MPAELLTLTINGLRHEVPSGVTVLAALQLTGVEYCRRSVSGELRSGICGMGICFECRVTIDGMPHQRACMIRCRSGMEVVTGA
jgi:predicted molibdopterin-dependent oxidoreductase YjgC